MQPSVYSVKLVKEKMLLSQEAGDPLTGGGRDCELGDVEKNVWVNRVKNHAEVHKEYT